MRRCREEARAPSTWERRGDDDGAVSVQTLAGHQTALSRIINPRLLAGGLAWKTPASWRTPGSIGGSAASRDQLVRLLAYLAEGEAGEDLVHAAADCPHADQGHQRDQRVLPGAG